MAYRLVKIDKSTAKESYIDVLKYGEAVVREEGARSRWRVRSGDVFLLASGSGERLAFLGTARVVAYSEDSVEPAEEFRRSLPDPDGTDDVDVERPTYRREITLADGKAFDVYRYFGELVYSLERVKNLSQPWRHVRDHSVLTKGDFDRIVENRVAVRRSIYFGLLRHLPDELRRFFQVDAAVRLLSEVEPGDLDHPAAQLIDGLLRSVLLPVELASQASLSLIRTLDGAEVVVGSEDGDVRLSSLLNENRQAAGSREEMEELKARADEAATEEGTRWPRVYW